MKSFSDYIVDVNILRQNVINIKNLIGNKVDFCAIVKANAYGVGVETVCKTIFGLADFFAVANVNEGLNIRIFDKITKVLILGVCDTDSLILCSQQNLSISVGDFETLLKFNKFAIENNLKLKVHLQINTGLNRFGFRSIIDFKRALKLLTDNEFLVFEGVYSHFATKDNDVKFIKKQFLRFLQFKNVVKNKDIIFHICNSFATLYNKKYRLNMVRNGFLMYGGTKNNIGNKLVVSIKSKVASIMNTKKNDTIGYDRTYLCDRALKIAVVPVGYADGLDRRLSNKFYVLINGQKCRILGNICMDVFMVDISNMDVNLGDEVVILGKQKNEEITLEDMAKVLNNSPYEVLLRFNYKRMNYIVKR